MSGGCRQRLWLLGHDDPGDQVSNDSCACEDYDQKPDQADQCHVQIQIFGDASSDTGDFAVLPRTNEAFAGGYSADPNSTIGTDVGIVLNDFATVVAIHGATSLL